MVHFCHNERIKDDSRERKVEFWSFPFQSVSKLVKLLRRVKG